jgi:LPXTG-motif cell wall-anchored protein
MDGTMGGNTRINTAQLAYLGAAAGAMVIGLIYAFKKKRRKFTS